MKIVVVGLGKVGRALTQQLSADKHDIVVIDRNPTIVDDICNICDVRGVTGNGGCYEVQAEAFEGGADLLIAATDSDEINILACLVAKKLNTRHTIARIRNPEYNDQAYRMRDVFGLSMVINPENQAATEIHRLLKYPGSLRRDTFAKGRTEIVELRVDASSKLCNVRLVDLQSIIRCKVLVCAVLRGGQAITPGGDFMLREGDRLFITALSENLTTLLKNLGILTRQVRRAMLCGGGRVSYYLAKMLEKDGVNVQLIEQNAARCRQLAAMLPNTCIVQGDCSSQARLETEGISGCDALVSLTGIDEMNMIISLYAASRGVRQVITKLGRSENSTLAGSLALGSVICPRELCSNTIVRYVRAMQNQTGAAVSVHAIADGQAEAVEFLVEKNSKHCGEPLKNMKLRPNILIASITRGAGTEIPSGDSRFAPGDTVVVVSERGVLRQFNDIFA